MKKFESLIPLDVPSAQHKEFSAHMSALTHGTGKLMLFSGDQKIEHLVDSFWGSGIDPADIHPEHLFAIARQARIGALATHLGYIARYAHKQDALNFIVKINAKTNLIPSADKDPLSSVLWSVDQVAQFKQHSKLNICGVGYTLYLGSEHEAVMLQQAAQVVYQAHEHGLVAILWVYPRGKYIKDDEDGKLIAGAASVAMSLGADFVKVKPPREMQGATSSQQLKLVTEAAGNTGVLCSGGATRDPEEFFKRLFAQLHIGNVRGCAVGRNIHQRSIGHAVAFAQACSALVYDDATVEEAMKLYKRV